MCQSITAMTISDADVRRVFLEKHGPVENGWRGPRLRWRFGYFTPDDIYEAVVSRLVISGIRWLDIGCGRDLFPSNPRTAKTLAASCERLVGVDPSPNVLENPLLHEAHQATIEDFQSSETFDLVTLRMVAEHISNPAVAVPAMTRFLRPGGRIVVYTVNRFAPLTMVSQLIPFQYHHRIKELVWGTEEQDTFPVEYRMNTRAELKQLFANADCDEELFMYLDDCRTFAKFPAVNTCELISWRLLKSVGLHYPETCLLGVYRRRNF